MVYVCDYDNLPKELEPQAQLLDSSTGWMPMDFQLIKEARTLGYPVAPYFGVYAVEGSEVQSVVRVLRLPYTLANGDKETVSAIQGVVTRRERSGKGLARKLLEEVHRREAEAGMKFVLLWTGHAMVAHNLYLSMGYKDVYTPMLAIRKCDGPGAQLQGYTARTPLAEETRTLHRLHTGSTTERVGFTPRPEGLLQALFRLGLVGPDSFRLILRGEDPVGYFQLKKEKGWIRSDEVVLSKGTDPIAALSALESECGGGWLTILGTFVRDNAKLLRERGYLLTSYSYSGLLARPLQPGNNDVLTELGMDHKSFTCQFLDYF
jgi:GNAT superfamily N-acetyltransferase